MKWDFEGGYLAQFDRNYYGTIGDRFCRAVRAGHEDVQSILDWVANNLIGNNNPVWRQVKLTCENGDAWDFAQHMLDRESLPYEEKQKLKETKRKVNVNYAMEQQPATEKQLAYLKSLGYRGTTDLSKLDARDLITGFLTSRELPRMEMPKDCPF